MGFVLENVFAEILCFLLLLVWLFYWYVTRKYDYWLKRGVPCKKPIFPFGSTKGLYTAKTFRGKVYQEIYKDFPNERYFGIIEFHTPSLVVKDPELIKHILVKDFQHFVDRPLISRYTNEYILRHLLNLKGQDWKDMRSKLTPTFTSGKMKSMFELLDKCGVKLKQQLESEIKMKDTIDAKNILGRFTLEVIASCAFGIESGSISKTNEFFCVMRKAIKVTKYRFLKRVFLSIFPFLIGPFRINLLPTEIRDFVTKIVKDTVAYRQKNEVKRNDFLDLLMHIGYNNNKTISSENKSASQINGPVSTSSGGLTIEQMAAQTYLFFLAGFETSSTLMTFSLYEMALHQDVQEKAYQEIKEAVNKNGGHLSYHVLTDMVPYLEQVIDESSRLFSATYILSRQCTEPYKIPDSDLVIEKDMKVIIPSYCLHHDPQFYPDPYTFKPERFAPEETKKRSPFVFLPFGRGPRNCIGERFGYLQAKVGLATVLLNFHVELSPEQEVPIEIDKKALLMIPAKPVLLKLKKRVDTSEQTT